ncbi:BLUF domain-containing protein [Sphingomonas montana]|uniref:BLUF domain-containing protein n=1 Tax=Sphingomonas montana TaxID=1843236 RepID=UPI00096C3C7B|nr:BLUF domain-containing protein [Sphingomonas montana]
MLQLVYASRATDAWDGDLHGLCVQCAGHNEREEITGVVLFENGTFLHALEGPREGVENIFIEIVQDKRHHSLHLLSRRRLTQREFGYGAMVELDTPEARDEALSKVGDIVSLAGGAARTAFDEYFGTVGGDPVQRSVPANDRALAKLWRDGSGARG